MEFWLRFDHAMSFGINANMEVAFMFRKNKNPEKIGARARNTPLGAYCYALTNKST
uniref:Uncharacterized protein n=1 Tax=Candidatus Kentrum sp. SD TaxID=2126332 RepID=A0A451BK03_9GAMM|nr:MAG: hypothetical protein BECKSD772F_GA0070984_102228 [Candidatus Kentron sp. SD]VFK43041.1 MAG: hypothetical protein BECKSD772E_GA0070983_102128 [Candidatus Kentron sp. SD]VFK78613.1 MAG: hypothetical protein BECKSD772D_GA0070982_101926 [Candidatus Kentron sp. SD]